MKMRPFMSVFLICILTILTTDASAGSAHGNTGPEVRIASPDTSRPHLLIANEDGHGDSSATHQQEKEDEDGKDPEGSHTAPHCKKGHLWVKLISPVTGSSFPAGKPVSVTADAGVRLGQSGLLSISYIENGNSIILGSSSMAPYTAGMAQPGEGVYRVFAKVTNGVDSAYSDTITVTITGCHGAGNILAEKYDGIPGIQVADLQNAPTFPATPTVTALLSAWTYGPGIGDNYGARVRGYICAPSSGYYTFYISGDDQAGLWLSTDDDPANKKLIANVESWVPFGRMDRFPAQRSEPIFLAKGGRYYIETLHKQLVGPNHLIVAWTMPGGIVENPIPGTRLSPMDNIQITPRVNSFTQVPQDTSFSKPELLSPARVVPNPSSDLFRITLSGSDHGRTSIKVMDLSGRPLESHVWELAPAQVTLGSKLKPGIYLVEIVRGGKKEMQRILKL